MRRFPVIILAGGERGPLVEATGYPNKARIPVHGKAMVEWVVDAFAGCSRVGDLVVVGPPELDHLPAMARVRRRIPSGRPFVGNVLRAVAYVKWGLHRGRGRHEGYVIAPCDAVFLTPEIVEDTLAAIDEADADMVMSMVERDAFVAAGLPPEHTYYTAGSRQFTGGAVYYVRSFRKLLPVLRLMPTLRRHRKDGRKIFEILGCDGSTPESVERALERRFGLRVRVCISPHPELGMDVDKPSDLELALRLKAKPPFRSA